MCLMHTKSIFYLYYIHLVCLLNPYITHIINFIHLLLWPT